MSRKIAPTKARLFEYLENQGLSKAEFYRKTGISPSNFKGKSAENDLGAQTIAAIVTSYPEIDTTWLLTGRESDLNKQAIDHIVKKAKQEVTRLQHFNVMHVPFVNQYAHAGYLSGFSDPTFMNDLPTIPFIVDKEYKGDYVSFEVKGDSMDDGSDQGYKEGDILLCRNLDKSHWESKLHIHKWDFVIVHSEEGILVKRIINHNVETGDITLHSLNDFYPEIKLNLSKVSQIFNVVEFQRKRKR